MTPDDIKTMRELRNEGYTYQAIADKFGCTKQCVHHLIGNRSRKNNADIESIVYEGIYKLFKSNSKMTFRQFTSITFGYESINRNQWEVIRRFLKGESEAKLTISQINNICRLCGMSYEETFKRRSGNE